MDYTNSIIDEIHRYRREHAERFNYDLEAMYADRMSRKEELIKQGYKFYEPPAKPTSAVPVPPQATDPASTTAD